MPRSTGPPYVRCWSFLASKNTQGSYGKAIPWNLGPPSGWRVLCRHRGREGGAGEGGGMVLEQVSRFLGHLSLFTATRNMCTSLIRKRNPLGPYHRPMPRVLGGS